ncbi:MAG: galactose mutarotase [Alistipes sp.]|nr:galactose mutarotase [Alistipes sp.]
MEIEQHIWGVTSEGEAVVLYTMRSAAGAEVRLCNIGASVVSVRVPDRDGRLADVALGYRDFADYFGDPCSCGKIIGRTTGCISYGRMTIDAEEFRLDCNAMAGHCDGGAKGFANRLWECRVETDRVVMSLLSEEGDQGYPGTLRTEVAFDFDEEHALEITYAAQADRKTPVDLSHRIFWNLGGETGGSVLGHELRLEAARLVECDERTIPTGRLLDGADRFAAWHPLAEETTPEALMRLRGDETFALTQWRRNILARVGELRDPKSGRRLELLSSQPCVTLCRGGRLGGGSPVGKSGARYADFDGAALVCSGYPDAVNRPEFPSSLLEAGAIYRQKTVYRFGTF